MHHTLSLSLSRSFVCENANGVVYSVLLFYKSYAVNAIELLGQFLPSVGVQMKHINGSHMSLL